MRVRWVSYGGISSIRATKAMAAIVVHPPRSIRSGYGFGNRLDLAFWDTKAVGLTDRVLLRFMGRDPDACLRLRDAIRGRPAWPWRPPMDADAEEVVRFVDGLPESVGELVVACEYGRSRSRAIAEWSGRRLGVEATGDVSGTPNPMMVAALARAERRTPRP